jgi:hypothetical protein
MKSFYRGLWGSRPSFGRNLLLHSPPKTWRLLKMTSYIVRVGAELDGTHVWERNVLSRELDRPMKRQRFFGSE